MIDISNLKGAFLGVNMYVLRCGGHALVVDPIPNMSGTELESAVLDGIILTHEHYDHICGVEKWKEAYSCPVYAGSSAVKGLSDPRMNMSHYGIGTFEVLFSEDDSLHALGEISDYSLTPDCVWEDGEVFLWQENEIRILHTPGHSAGSICLCVNGKYLFCGDTLLADLPTGLRWKGSNARRFREETIPKLRALDRNLLVCPGHGNRFLLGDYQFWEQTT